METKKPNPKGSVTPSTRAVAKPRATSEIALARARVSRNLSRRLPYYLTPAEAHRMISVVENNARDHLFLRVLWETGARVSEAIALQLTDVSRDGIRVLGKGSRERVIYIQDSLVSEILFYAQEMDLGRNELLFRSRKGGHITKQRADQIIKLVARRARLERNVHAHLFRHGYAVNFLNCSGRLDALQEQLGHKDINTTRIYLRLTASVWPVVPKPSPLGRGTVESRVPLEQRALRSSATFSLIPTAWLAVCGAAFPV